MILTAFLAQGGSMVLGAPISMVLQQDESAPADRLSLLFPLQTPFPHIQRLTVEQEDDLIFDGIVDEQCAGLSSDGRILRLEARSKAALLLDNEAMPQQYERPSLPLLFERHARPYGFSRISGSDEVFSGKMTVSKGMSEWQVLESFCRLYLHTSLFATSQGELFTTKLQPSGIITFGQQMGNTPFLSLEEIHLPYRRISEVLVRPSNQGGYTVCTVDPQAVAQGIQRRRYYNAPPGSGRPASYGEEMLRQARRESYRVEVLCPGWVPASIHMEAQVPEIPEALEISALQYQLDASGEQTRITLRRREEGTTCGLPNIL